MQVDRIVFCVYKDKDYEIYSNLLPLYFPAPQNFNLQALDLATSIKPDKETENNGALKSLRETLNQVTMRATGAEIQARQEALKSDRLQDLVTTLERSNEEKSQRIAEDGRQIRTLESRVRRLEGDLYNSQLALREAHEQADRLETEQRDMEMRLSNSDRVFQEVLQRLIGQIPQSQPFWVVSRQEINFTSEELGAGGWATVKVAIFRCQRVAAKCLHHQIVSAHNIRLFTREMNIAAQARHPNLLQFIGATMDAEPVILTELLPTSLRHLMETTNLSKQQIKSLSCDVARALNYLHLSSPDPIIHRDVSSGNILLEATGENNWKAKLADYGSANFVRYTTTAGPGNPLYSAPEVGDPKKHSPKMDTYSFGILLIEMCSGKKIFVVEHANLCHMQENCLMTMKS